MAATNYTPIQLYYSTTASAAPTAGNLTSGELAINITDGKLYYKDNGGVVQVIATKGAGTIGGSTTQIQYNNAGALAGSAAMTFNSGTNTVTLTTLNLTNALGATYGGTAQSAYTQGDFLYASATNTLSKLGIGTVNYILTSTGSVPQWSAPSSVTVQTATNLAGGAGGSVPYQSAADTTTFLAIGAANRVMTSSGTAPQWVTALTGLTGVSSSSITNTSLTSGRVVYSTTGGAQTDSSSLTFNGTTLSAGGFSTTGLTTLVKTVTVGDSNFSGTAVFAAATPAKLYIGTGTVTDTTSAIGATNAVGAISSLAITPIAATNTSVTYTNASTLYIAGAPSAGTNVTITNPYALYIAAGDVYLGGGTVNGVAYLNGSKQLTTGSALTFDGTGMFSVVAASGVGMLQVYENSTGNNNRIQIVQYGTVTTYNSTFSAGSGAHSWQLGGSERMRLNSTGLGIGTDSPAAKLDVNGGALIQGLTVGRGAGAVATNTASGYQALYSNTTGIQNTASGYAALPSNTTGNNNTASGYAALQYNTTGSGNTASGYAALNSNTTGNNNTASGYAALYNTTGGSNTAVGYQAAYSNTTGARLTAIGLQAGYFNNADNNTFVGQVSGYSNSSGANNSFFGQSSGYANTTGGSNTALGKDALLSNTTGSGNTASGQSALQSNTTGSNNTASGYQAFQSNTTGYNNTASGVQALFYNTTGNSNTASGFQALQSNTTGSGNTAINPLNSAGSYVPVFNPTTENNRFCMGSTGVTNAYIQVAWTVVSDARDKTDFAPVPHGLDFVTQLQPTAYRYKMNREDTEGHGPVRYGFKAQEVLALEGNAPVIVDAEDSEKLRFNDQSMIAVLVNAVKELKIEFDLYKSTHP